jgi:hypothetical protein
MPADERGKAEYEAENSDCWAGVENSKKCIAEVGASIERVKQGVHCDYAQNGEC